MIWLPANDAQFGARKVAASLRPIALSLGGHIRAAARSIPGWPHPCGS